MTFLYWTAAVAALLSGARSATRLRRDRSLMVATSVLCMLALSAALMMIAITPALLQARPSDAAVTWTSGSLGLLGTWTFLGVLAAVTGDSERPLTLITIPVLAAASAGLLQTALEHAGHATGDAGAPAALPIMVCQLALLTYYCPALGRIAILAWHCSRRIPVRHIDAGMQAVATAAVAELAVVVIRAAVIIVATSGVRVTGPEIAGIALAQGIAILLMIGGVTVGAWFPVLASAVRRAWTWSAYWRLRPLWAALSRAVPQVTLPPQPGTRLNARYRLHRRVIEIRDAQLELRPYWRGSVAAQAADAARAAGLPGSGRDAVVEAALTVTGINARLRGEPARDDQVPAEPAGPVPGNDLGAETARLLLVSRALRYSPIVQALGPQPGRGAALVQLITGSLSRHQTALTPVRAAGGGPRPRR